MDDVEDYEEDEEDDGRLGEASVRESGRQSGRSLCSSPPHVLLLTQERLHLTWP